MLDNFFLASFVSATSVALLLGFRTYLKERDLHNRSPKAKSAFTWWTYRVAKRRSFKREYNAFLDHYVAVRGPEEWRKAMRLTALIEARRIRERQGRCACGHSEAYHSPTDVTWDGLERTLDICYHESRTMLPGMVLLCGCRGYARKWWPYDSKKYKPFTA